MKGRGKEEERRRRGGRKEEKERRKKIGGEKEEEEKEEKGEGKAATYPMMVPSNARVRRFLSKLRAASRTSFATQSNDRPVLPTHCREREREREKGRR